ncbi:MAG: SDR family NAD(P)-dependent oxidoreductase [Segetibacter sp.]
MQTVVITGANSGIGLATAKALARQQFQLIILVRSQQKANETKAEIQKEVPNAALDFYIADLTDFAAVKKAAENIKAKYTSINRLINNAGYSPVGIHFTADGYEKSFAANHLGHFVLTMNLLGCLKIPLRVALSHFHPGRMLWAKKQDFSKRTIPACQTWLLMATANWQTFYLQKVWQNIHKALRSLLIRFTPEL